MKKTLIMLVAMVAVSVMPESGTTYRQDRTKTTRDAQGRTIYTETTHTNADGSTTTTRRDTEGRTTQTERSNPPTRYPSQSSRR